MYDAELLEIKKMIDETTVYHRVAEELVNAIREDAIDEFARFIDKHSHITKDGCEVALDDDITILAEQFKERIDGR